jgi:uncharacterized protein (DUF1501 family)
MRRREFLKCAAVAPLLAGHLPSAVAQTAIARYDRLLVLIELKGGNDGLNTVVPFADERYAKLRPRLAVARDRVLQLDEQTGLHPALSPLMSLWQEGHLAIVQGVGYPQGNLSHFRSIEIWDTASRADEYLSEGWLSRAFATAPVPDDYAADGVVIGAQDLGPLAGNATRVIALADTARFQRQARLAEPADVAGSPALQHIMRVERDIVHAASGLNGNHAFHTEFPRHAFGAAVRTASQVVASPSNVAVLRIALTGFDTHSNQVGTHARLLQWLAEGISALRQALVELGRWDKTLMMTYSEFGRRAGENLSGGTDHGTASVHFLTGGAVKGGLYGARPALDRLDGNGNLPFAIDFRALYATVLARWWGMDAVRPLQVNLKPLDVLRV